MRLESRDAAVALRVRRARTASATTLTINSAEDDKDKKYHVDLPQFLSIVRTLWPRIELTEAVTFFREAHDHSEGEIGLEVSLEIADRRQFFTQTVFAERDGVHTGYHVLIGVEAFTDENDLLQQVVVILETVLRHLRRHP